MLCHGCYKQCLHIHAVLVPDTITGTLPTDAHASQMFEYVCACHTSVSSVAGRQNAIVNIGAACRGQRLSMCSSQ